MGEKKESGATRLRPLERAGLHLRYERLHLFEHLRIQLIVDPASILSVANDPRVLEHAEMERKPGLRGVESVCQLANAALSLPEQLDDLEPGLVGKRVKELDRPI